MAEQTVERAVKKMKKEYKRPTIEIEEFRLSSHIAGSCGLGANSGNSFGKPNFQQGSCGWLDRRGKVIFTNDVSGCEVKYGEGVYNRYCYHGPVDEMRCFNS